VQEACYSKIFLYEECPYEDDTGTARASASQVLSNSSTTATAPSTTNLENTNTYPFKLTIAPDQLNHVVNGPASSLSAVATRHNK
jgi:hypothetical protein